MAGTNRTPTGTKTVRCKAVEGAQQCVSATHGKLQNHRWGKPGETDQWNEDGSPKIPDRDHTDQLPRVPEGGFVDVPESPMDAAAMQTPATPDLADHWTCAAKVRDDFDGTLHVCDRHDEHDPDPAVQGHHWRQLSQAADLDGDNAPDPVMERDLQDMEAAREEQRADVADQRRAAIAAAVTDTDRKDMERIGASHPDVVRPTPVRQSAADLPGHSIGDITADDAMDSVLFDDTEAQLKLERIWLRTAARTILRVGAERHRYGKLADAEQLMALRDQVEHLLTNRGLVGGGGSA
jgi:hypothetical protein